MQIISVIPRTETYITGQMSDGSDRQVVEVTEYKVVVEVALQRYVATLHESDEKHIIDAFNNGLFTIVPKSTGQRVEELESQNLTNMLAVFDLFSENEQLKADKEALLEANTTNMLAIFDLYAEIESLKGGDENVADS